jgi:hypothetical protein
MEAVIDHAAGWFDRHLRSGPRRANKARDAPG